MMQKKEKKEHLFMHEQQYINTITTFLSAYVLLDPFIVWLYTVFDPRGSVNIFQGGGGGVNRNVCRESLKIA